MGNQDICKHISAEEFSKLNFSAVTLLDLREPDEVLTGGIEGALNIPFSGGFSGLDTIPQGKPVVVICRTGNWSEEVAELLADRGYEAASLDGGYKAYKAFLNEGQQDGKPEDRKEEQQEEKKADIKGSPEVAAIVDAKNLKCPGPIVKVADYLRDKPNGTTILAEATEDAFASDIRVWCERTGNRLDALRLQNRHILLFCPQIHGKQLV